MEYEQAKEIAVEFAESHEIVIDKAGEIGNAYVFDNSNDEYMDFLPIAIDKATGKLSSLWIYLQGLSATITMDDVVSRKF